MATVPEYPESSKLLAVQEESQRLGAFLDWLQERFILCQAHHHSEQCYADPEDSDRRQCGCREGEFVPARVSIEGVLALYFGVDLKKVEEENGRSCGNSARGGVSRVS